MYWFKIVIFLPNFLAVSLTPLVKPASNKSTISPCAPPMKPTTLVLVSYAAATPAK